MDCRFLRVLCFQVVHHMVVQRGWGPGGFIFSGPLGELCPCLHQNKERNRPPADSTEAFLTYCHVRQGSVGKGKGQLFGGWVFATPSRGKVSYWWAFYPGTNGEAIRSWLCTCWLFCYLWSRWSFGSQDFGFGTGRRYLFALGCEVCIVFLLSSRSCVSKRLASIDKRSSCWPSTTGWFGGVPGSLQLPDVAEGTSWAQRGGCAAETWTPWTPWTPWISIEFFRNSLFHL